MKYTIVPMQPAVHTESLLSLWKKNLSRYFEGRFYWLYDPKSYGQAIAWLSIIDHSGEIVGSGGFYKRSFIINKEQLVIGIAADFMIKKEHRVFGPALPIQQTIRDNWSASKLTFMFAFPNKASEGVFKRAGYQRLAYSNNWVKLLRTERKLVAYVKVKWIASFIGKIINQLLRLPDRMKLLKAKNSFHIKILNSCCPDFDDLWQEAKDNFSIIGEKSSAYLKWRYIDCKTKEYQFYCLYDRTNSRLRGYLVYAIQDELAEIEELLVADFHSTLDWLLLSFSEQMRIAGIHSISINFLGRTTFEDSLRRAGFFRRNSNRSCMIYINDKRLATAVLDIQNWFIFDGEMDL